MSLEKFRTETREWLQANCPDSMRNRTIHFEEADAVYATDEAHAWLDTMAERGWTVPRWPTEYGGGGLDSDHARILAQEMAALKTLPPAAGMGTAMIGPTLLDYGTEDQKQRHLPKIVKGEVRWCQGYSEPGAGSDLAGLQTKAVLDGDQFIINGQKIWTSGADISDWIFLLVRTDPDAPKHEGISFVLVDMNQPGVSTRPIKLISGSSPFCETFFDDAVARREDLIGEMNKGWTVAKRLLQYERSPGDGGARPSKKGKPAANAYADLAKRYVGEQSGRVADAALRDDVIRQTINERALQLTVRRAAEEHTSGGAPGAATSIFKYVGSTLSKQGSQLKSTLRGTGGLGWDGPGFDTDELESTRGWLRDRATTIYGGTNEVQLNIISKRVLGLPD
jgi:alkylation response protein AidB-like acyl-CoA dehydrogenase